MLPALLKTNRARLAVASAFLCAALSAEAAELRVLTDRTDDGPIRAALEAFEKESGAQVKVVFIDQGLLARMSSRPSEADVVITLEVGLLEQAKRRGLLAPMSPKTLEAVPPEFRDADGAYLVDAYRARAIVASRSRVGPNAIQSYEDLAKPQWRGRLCIRSGLHDYNIALFDQFIASWGEDKARAVIGGMAANLARAPKGNDREQAAGIAQGVCDVALINSYYYPKMLASPAQKPWADAIQVIFPDQAGRGTFIMRSGVAITKAASNRELAERLAAFLVTPKVQASMVERTQQYSVLPSVPAHPSMIAVGKGQGLKDGRFKIQWVDLGRMASSREAAIKIVNEVGFDKGPAS